MPENPPSERRSHDERQWNSRHKIAASLGAILANEPVTQVHNHARKKSGLRRTQKQSRPIELARGMNQSSQHGQRSPRDQDQSDATPCAPAFDHERARNLQRHVADEKNARAQAEHPIAEPKRPRHPDRGIGYAGAVKIISDVEDEEKRKQPYGDLMASMIRKLDVSPGRERSCRAWSHCHSNASGGRVSVETAGQYIVNQHDFVREVEPR